MRDHPLFPKPKVLAGLIVGGVVYALGAVGVDLSDLIQKIENEVGVELPDTQALTVALAGFIAAYLKRD